MTLRLPLVRAFVLLALLCLVVRATNEEDDEEEDMDGELAEEVSEEDVLVLGKSNFTETLKKYEYLMVEFYAPWCGYCQQLKPEYAAAATALRDEASVALAKVDATVEEELAQQYDVEGYPDIKFFINGTAMDYSGGRDEESIFTWVTKQMGPLAETIETAEQLKAKEGTEVALLLAYFQTLDDSNSGYKAFKAAAAEVEMPILQTSAAEVAKAADGMEPGTVALVKNAPNEPREVVKYTGAMAAEPLRKFAAAEALPLVTPFTEATTELIFNSDISRHLLLVGAAKDIAPGGKLHEEFKAASAELRPKQEFIFVAVDAEGEEGEPVVEYFKLTKASLPAVVGFQIEPEQRRYSYSGKLDKAGFVKFASGILDGSVQPEYSSQEVPEIDMDGPVKVVVAKSFDKIVQDPSKDVLLEVYAPWCGHCKALEPTYRQLAESFKGIDSVVVAKVDGTENEHPSLDVEGFPSLLFFPAEKGAAGIEFDDDRTLEAMAAFIKKNAKTTFEMPELVQDADTDPVDGAAAAAAPGSDKDEL